MGSPLGSSGLAAVATISIAVSAILLIVAGSKVRSVTGYSSSGNLKVVNNDIGWAQIYAWIATAFALILLLGYVLVHNELLQNEWLHLVVWILAMVAIIVSIVYIGIAMNKVHNVSNDQGTESYLWAALIFAGIGGVILLMMGIWRLIHKNIYGGRDKAPQAVNALYAPATQYVARPTRPTQPQSVLLASEPATITTSVTSSGRSPVGSAPSGEAEMPRFSEY